MSATIQTDAVITGISAGNDGGLRARFMTPEMTGEEKAAFFELQNRNVKLLIKPMDEPPTALHDIKGEFDRKSPSRRMRDVLWRVWEYETQQEKTALAWEDFYVKRMSRITDELKAGLPPRGF